MSIDEYYEVLGVVHGGVDCNICNIIKKEEA